MVKKTQWKYLFSTVKKNGVTFFAVALIAATSIAIFLGIRWAAVAILQQVDTYFRENQLASAEIACANGITQEDVEELQKQPGVDAAEGGYRTMVLMQGEKEQIILQVRSLLDEMNEPVLLEGELPKAGNEAAVEQDFAKELGVSVGDEISIEHDGELLYEHFQVTAIINEPSFSCSGLQDVRGISEVGTGAASYYIEVPKEAFDAAYYDDCYTNVYVKNSTLSAVYFYAEEYTEKETAFKEELENFGDERADKRYEALNDRAEEGIAELEEKAEALESTRNELKEQLATLESTFMGAKCGIMVPEGMAAEIEEKKAEIESGLEEIDSQSVQLESALQEAEEKAAEIERKDWVISGRNNMGDVRAIETLMDGLYALSYSLALIFLLVAVIVCYAAIVRMIDDQKTLIGAQKALGFTSREILVHYLKYNTLCAFLGVALGCVAAVVIVENLIVYICGKQLLFEHIPRVFVWKEALLVALLCLVIYLSATFAGCIKMVRQFAIALLRGEEASKKKAYIFEKWAFYRKMNLYSRTMIKNVLGDKGRMLTTIMGVIGCISLVIITFTMKFSITDAPKKQYADYFLYENWMITDSRAENTEEFERVLKEEGISYRKIQDKLKNFRIGGDEWNNVHVVTVEEPGYLEDFICFEDVETGKQTKIPQEGVLISRKCAEVYGVECGSVIELMNTEGDLKECQVVGIIEHYLPYHLLVMCTDHYEEVMEEEADESVFLLQGEIEGLYDRVKDMDGFLSIQTKSDNQYEDMSSSLNLVIVICLTFSAVLALLVLMNQITMYINRKARELAVMRINGYTLKETKTFVSRDNIVLTILGLMLGCGFGIPVAYFEVCILESKVGPNHYVRTPSLLACVLSVLFCVVCSVVVNRIALKKIDHLSLTNVSGN